MRRFGIVLVAAGLAFVGASCGGDDDGGGGEALSKEDFIEQADAICAEFNEAQVELFDEYADLDPEDPDQLREFADELLPLFEQQIDDVQELAFPEDDREMLEEAFADTEAALEELKERIEDDPVAAFASEDDPFADVEARMADYGFVDCASGAE